MRLAMVFRLRDEADIIEQNLRYHRAQGVDLFIVADRGSTDGTLEILERHERAGHVKLERVGRGGDRERGSEIALTRLAMELGADWIIHNDADEFWWPLAGSLKETLAAVPEQYGLVVAPRSEFAARPGDDPFFERMTAREARFLRPPKAAHRAHEQIKVRGSQPSEIWIRRDPAGQKRLIGRAALRSKAEHDQIEQVELAISPEFTVGVLRFPVRSFEQYRRRVELALEGGELDGTADGREVREAYEAGQLRELYGRLTLDDDAVRQGLTEGWLVEDTSLRDYLRAAPDPFDGGEAPPGADAWPEERRTETRARLQHDAMYALSRYLQTYAHRTQTHRRERARRKQVERRMWRQVATLRRQDRRLTRIESSLWWRLRPRLPAIRRRRRKRR